MRCSVIFSVTLRHLVINISLSSPADNTAAYYQRCVNLRDGGRGTGNRVYNTWPVAALAQAVKRDIGSESRILPTTPAFDAPFRVSRRRIIPISFGGKTRMVWLPDSEKISKISLFVLTECTNVTDTRADRRTDTA